MRTTPRSPGNTGSVNPWFVAGEKDQANLFNDELKMSAKRKTMSCYSPKYPRLDQ